MRIRSQHAIAPFNIVVLLTGFGIMFKDIFFYERNLMNGPTLYIPWECPIQEYRLPFIHKQVRNIPTAYAEPLLTVM